MAIWSRKTETTPQGVDVTKNDQQTINPGFDVDALGRSIAQGVVQGLQPMFERRSDPAPQTQLEADPDADADPAELERIRRVARAEATQGVEPYVQVFQNEMPVHARNMAVNNLNPTEKKIYDRHKAEVDKIINDAYPANHPGRASSMVHTKAIRMVFAEHLDEIEREVVSSLTAEDLPPEFNLPGYTKTQQTNEPSLTEQERIGLEGVQRTSPRRGWTEKDYKFWSQIKPGSQAEMIAQYRAMKEAEK